MTLKQRWGTGLLIFSATLCLALSNSCADFPGKAETSKPGQNSPSDDTPIKMVNPFESPGQWYKANFHAHTNASDGNVPTQERIQQYREKGYAILAITDHNRVINIKRFSSEDFLAINSAEINDRHGSEPRQDYHLVCLNLPLDFRISSTADANTHIKLVKKAGGEVIIAHPYWSAHNVNNLLKLNGYIGIEVYNGVCSRMSSKGISSVYWDDLLDAGRMVPANAADDTHINKDIAQGWTMLKAKELNVTAVMDALRTGCYYSSSGPIIEDLRIEDGTRIVVRCSPAVEIYFIGQGPHGRTVYASKDKTLTSAEYRINPRAKYIRVEIVDASGKRAWSNPIILQQK